MNIGKSPWSAYGRLTPESDEHRKAAAEDVTFGALDNVARGREQLQKCLNQVMREYHEIRSGETGYQKIVDDVLHSSGMPESIEERLARLAREAAARRPNRSTGSRRV